MYVDCASNDLVNYQGPFLHQDKDRPASELGPVLWKRRRISRSSDRPLRDVSGGDILPPGIVV